MSIPRDAALLIERYLDGDLDAAGRQRLSIMLRNDAVLAADFGAQLDLSLRLADVHTGEDFASRTIRRVAAALREPDLRPASSNTERLRQLARRSGGMRVRRGPRARAWSWAVPLAAGVMIALLGAVLMSPRSEDVAVVTWVGGDGSVMQRRQQQVMVVRGLALHADDVLTTGGGTLTIRYGDGTQVRVEPASALAVVAGDGKRLRLDRGVVQAQVAPQPTAHPLRVTTTHGEAVVVGTRFTLAVSVSRTHLAVDEGRVRLMGRKDPAMSLEVVPGRAAIATAESIRWEEPATIAPLPPREILFVRRDAGSDRAVAARLIAAGYRVVDRSDAAVTAADATGKALVLISEQVSAQALGTRLREVEVPMMVWECGLYPGLGMSTAAGFAVPSRTLTIDRPQHPLAAGLSGAVALTRGTHPLSVVAVAAVPPDSLIATVPGISGRRGPLAAIIGYERGMSFPDGTRVPARRVGFFLSGDLESDLTPAGWALFDAAIAWCLGPEPPTRAPPP